MYGPDDGLVRERVGGLARTITDDLSDPFRYAEYGSSQISKDPAHLVDEVLAVSFGGGRRVLVVRGAGDDATNAISAVLENEAAGHADAALVIAAAGNLTPRSSMRRLFENSDICAALPCYPDDEAGLAQLIRGSLNEEGISIEPNALNTTTALLGSDRQANRKEIEKLVLFAGPGGHLTDEVVLACLGDSSEASAEEAIYSAADGNYEGLVEHLTRVWADGIEPVAVIRNAQRHFQRLHYVLAQTAGGTPLDSALKQLRPPVFWRVAGRFRGQLTSWNLANLEASIARLTDAELSAKTTGAPAALICDRTLMAITQLARAGRRKTNKYQ